MCKTTLLAFYQNDVQNGRHNNKSIGFNFLCLLRQKQILQKLLRDKNFTDNKNET